MILTSTCGRFRRNQLKVCEISSCITEPTYDSDVLAVKFTVGHFLDTGHGKFLTFWRSYLGYLLPLVACSAAYWVKAVYVDLQISIQRSTTLPWASRPCRWLARLASIPLRQHQSPAGTISQTVICRQPSFSSCCTSYVEQSAKHICSVITLFPSPSQDLSLSANLYGHYCNTWVSLTIALSI